MIRCNSKNNKNSALLSRESKWNDRFLNNLISFFDEPHKSQGALVMHSQIKVVTSGYVKSFCGKNYGDLTYRRCNFSNRVYTSWTNSSAGLIASTQPSYSTGYASRGKSASQLSPNGNAYVQTDNDKFQFFKEYLKKSLLPAFDNHPVRLKRIAEKIIDNQPSVKSEDTPSLNSINQIPPSINNDFAINQTVSSPNEPAKLGICKLCRKNGEPPVVYKTHVLKAPDGSVTCPILSRYVCDLCGATGSISHTRKYCPLYVASLMQQEYRKLSSGVIVYNMNHK